MITGAVFDVDGTLLDSMDIWQEAASLYLKGIGVEPREDLGRILFPMTVEQGAAYVIEEYGLKQTKEEIAKGVFSIVGDFYANEVRLKPGAGELLEELFRRKIPMAAATTGDRALVESAFSRLDVRKYFKKILTVKDVGKGKDEPDIYFLAAEALDSPAESTWVFEDGLYAARTASSAGFPVAGVYDRASEEDQEALKVLSSVYLGKERDYREFWKLMEERK